MGEPRKKRGKLLPMLGLLLVLVAGVGVAGYLKPDLPVAGPLVESFFEKGSKGVDQSGVYRVSIKQLVLSEEEFRDGERLDLQVTIEQYDAEGRRLSEWSSRQHGARPATVGETPLSANWLDRAFEVTWQPGHTFIVKVWDWGTLRNTLLCEWETDVNARSFPLSGSHTFARVKGKIARVAGASQITFEGARLPDPEPE